MPAQYCRKRVKRLGKAVSLQSILVGVVDLGALQSVRIIDIERFPLGEEIDG